MGMDLRCQMAVVTGNGGHACGVACASIPKATCHEKGNSAYALRFIGPILGGNYWGSFVKILLRLQQLIVLAAFAASLSIANAQVLVVQVLSPAGTSYDTATRRLVSSLPKTPFGPAVVENRPIATGISEFSYIPANAERKTLYVFTSENLLRMTKSGSVDFSRFFSVIEVLGKARTVLAASQGSNLRSIDDLTNSKKPIRILDRKDLVSTFNHSLVPTLAALNPNLRAVTERSKNFGANGLYQNEVDVQLVSTFQLTGSDKLVPLLATSVSKVEQGSGLGALEKYLPSRQFEDTLFLAADPSWKVADLELISQFLKPHLAALHRKGEFAKLGVWPNDRSIERIESQLKPQVAGTDTLKFSDSLKQQRPQSDSLMDMISSTSLLNTIKTSGSPIDRKLGPPVSPDRIPAVPAVVPGNGPDPRVIARREGVATPANDPGKKPGKEPEKIPQLPKGPDIRYVEKNIGNEVGEGLSNLNKMFGSEGALSDAYAAPGGIEKKKPAPTSTPAEKK